MREQVLQPYKLLAIYELTNLLLCGLVNDAVSSLDYTTPNNKIINK